MRFNGRFVMSALAALGILVVFGLFTKSLFVVGHHTPISDPDDFRAFYCAAHVTLLGGDPYRTEPLRACEHAAAAAFSLHFPTIFVYLAPLPPYALALLTPLGAVAFPIASTVWFVLGIAALATGVVITSRISGRSILLVAIAFTIAGGFVSIDEGQLAPFITLALCLAAQAIRSEPVRRCGIAWVGLAMLEPHVAIAAVLGVLIEKRARRVVACILCVLLAIDLFSGGPGRTAEYFFQVLPLHARLELASLVAQFSLTTMLWSFGASKAVAQLLGTIDYLAMIVLGLWVAARLAARFQDRAFLVFVPPTFVLLGGTYIHLFQVLIALPLAFLALGTMPKRRIVIALAILGLAVPIQYFVRRSASYDTFYPGLKVTGPAPAPLAARSPYEELAEEREIINRDAMQVERPTPSVAFMALVPKIPTWLALLALIVVCTAEATYGEMRSESTPLVSEPT
jgi:hypothetical protein